VRLPPAIPRELAAGPVSIRRYDRGDAEGLFVALDHPTVWEHIPRSVPTSPQELHDQNAGGLSGGDRVTLTVRRGEEIVGTTSVFFDAAEPRGVEIGATQLDPTVWGTGVNSTVKGLLTAALFEAGAEWVQFRTDERNHRSAAALRKLGARELGVRQDTLVRRDGTVRRSIFFRLERPETL
jgi:RimJ/RimL family protein N-acetyltransferase